MSTIKQLFQRENNRNDSEFICRCGKEFHDLENLIISLDDAGLTFYCDNCPENLFKVNRSQFELPYV